MNSFLQQTEVTKNTLSQTVTPAILLKMPEMRKMRYLEFSIESFSRKLKTYLSTSSDLAELLVPHKFSNVFSNIDLCFKNLHTVIKINIQHNGQYCYSRCDEFCFTTYPKKCIWDYGSSSFMQI